MENDVGWFTRISMPTNEGAEQVADELRQDYIEVEILPDSNGWYVRFRGPKVVNQDG